MGYIIYALLKISFQMKMQCKHYSKTKMSLADGLQMIKRRRPQAQPIPAFMEMLERYEKENGDGDLNRCRKRSVPASQVSSNDKKTATGGEIYRSSCAAKSNEQAM